MSRLSQLAAAAAATVQTIPVYALEDHNRRLRALKYTPQHMHCLAAVHAPLAPPNTGVVCIQAAAAGPNAPSSWRIAATAIVVEQEAELRIVKKLKLVGTPIKVSLKFTLAVLELHSFFCIKFTVAWDDSTSNLLARLSRSHGLKFTVRWLESRISWCGGIFNSQTS